jgi:hypothetical protein
MLNKAIFRPLQVYIIWSYVFVATSVTTVHNVEVYG